MVAAANDVEAERAQLGLHPFAHRRGVAGRRLDLDQLAEQLNEIGHASGLSLLEELFPASEQRLELVARAPVSGERLDVAPVLREALLEVRDLGLEPGDPRLDSLELGRRLRLRRARRGFRLALGRRSG